VLYVPASNARAVEKARSLACDAVVLDLEDAVAPALKQAARSAAATVIQAGGFGHREVIVRVNGLDTPWGVDDLAAMSSTNADAVLVPKIRTRQDLLAYDNALKGAHRALQLWTMIETALSLFHLENIASAAHTSRLTCFVMGTNDLAKELHMQLDHQRTPFTSLLALTVAAARAHGVALLDGVYNAFDDTAGFEAQCRQGVEYGFDGKTLIHPKQIDICNAAFSPSAAAISWAQQVKAEFALPENRDKGAVKVAGSMVERLHLAQAEQSLALDVAIKANGSI
jgi:citrate lyase subunit beta/citryl-CoA lyase